MRHAIVPLAAAALFVAVAAPALADHYAGPSDVPVVGSTIDDARDAAPVYVGYEFPASSEDHCRGVLAAQMTAEGLSVEEQGQSVSTASHTWYVCVSTDGALGLWKESNDKHGLQTEPIPTFSGEIPPDTKCFSPLPAPSAYGNPAACAPMEETEGASVGILP